MKEEYEKYCRFYRCEEKECWYNGCKCEGERLIIKEPKQETLEETAERLLPDRNGFTNRDRFNFIEGAVYREIEINDLKIQQERSYSEEEVLEIIRQYALEEHLITSSKPDEWFKQFKKK